MDDLLPLLSLTTLTLATSGPGGEAHAAPVYFAAGERLRLYFFSSQNSQHALDLAARPQAAAAIYPECFAWQEIRGLQLRGAVHRVEDEVERRAALLAYQAKFPFVQDLPEVVERAALYCFVPSWVRLVDNRRGLGYKVEWNP